MSAGACLGAAAALVYQKLNQALPGVTLAYFLGVGVFWGALLGWVTGLNGTLRILFGAFFWKAASLWPLESEEALPGWLQKIRVGLPRIVPGENTAKGWFLRKCLWEPLKKTPAGNTWRNLPDPPEGVSKEKWRAYRFLWAWVAPLRGYAFGGWLIAAVCFLAGLFLPFVKFLR